MKYKLPLILLLLVLLCSCRTEAPAPPPPVDRESLIPPTQTKITPEMDLYPPKSETAEYADPVPLPYPVNTAGAEDSAFITPDGDTLYLWFTPDVSVPPERQVIDGVSGIYVSRRIDDGWSRPERVLLQDSGKLALDGCEFVLGDRMWFCSAREGYTGIHWFTADLQDEMWENWALADFPSEYEVGELHISADGRELYFHSSRPGGQGDYDLWLSRWKGGSWGLPENLAALNSPETDGWPFISPDGMQLWFTRVIGAPSLYRSIRVDGVWTAPVLMFSNFAGEASMDAEGNIYFTHHFYRDDRMLEADIYVTRPIAP